MSEFIKDCAIGIATKADIDNYIENWHISTSELPIYDYLGMSKEEYTLFVQDSWWLDSIIAFHSPNRTIERKVA